MAHGSVAVEVLGEVFVERTVDEWRERLETFVDRLAKAGFPELAAV